MRKIQASLRSASELHAISIKQQIKQESIKHSHCLRESPFLQFPTAQSLQIIIESDASNKYLHSSLLFSSSFGQCLCQLPNQSFVQLLGVVGKASWGHEFGAAASAASTLHHLLWPGLLRQELALFVWHASKIAAHRHWATGVVHRATWKNKNQIDANANDLEVDQL